MALAGGVVTDAPTGNGIYGALVYFHIDGYISCDAYGRWATVNGYSGMTVTASASGHVAKSGVLNEIAYYPEIATYGLWKVIALDRTPPSSGGDGGGGGGGW